MEETVDPSRQSIENLEPGSDEPEVETAEDEAEEILSISEAADERQKKRGPEAFLEDDIDLGLDDRNLEETSKVMSDMHIVDYSKSFENFFEESDSEQDFAASDKIQFDNIYQGTIPSSRESQDVQEKKEEDDEEEENYSSDSSLTGREKLDEAVIDETSAEPSESDVVGLLADIPLEILRDRTAMIEKLRELNTEGSDLNQKNRLLQYWVARLMKKKHQTMKREDEVLAAEATDDRYMKKLVGWKTTIEEIEARQAEFHRELANMEIKLARALEEDSTSFGALLAREKELGVGLVFEKSGRTVGAKAMDALVRRKVLRRESLNRDRFKYIYYRHVLESVKKKLRHAESLGAGMTILDYEVLMVDNENYKEKLEEREKVLEKMAFRIEIIVGTLAHYKEKDVENRVNIYNEQKHLETVRSEALKMRTEFTEALTLLWSVRNDCLRRKRRAGMLFVLPVVHEMEKTIKVLDELKVELERMISIEEPKEEGVGSSRSKLALDESCTRRMTRMTRVKSGRRMKPEPGRC